MTSGYSTSVASVAMPWAWTGAITAVCSCPTNFSLSASKSISDFGTCTANSVSAMTTNSSAPCAEGLYRPFAASVCIPCGGYRVASANGSFCICPSGYILNMTTGLCSPPPLIIFQISGGGIDADVGGQFALIGSNTTSQGALYPLYGRTDPYRDDSASGSVDVFLTYLPPPIAQWSLSASPTTPLSPRYAFSPAASSLVLPIATSPLLLLGFNQVDNDAVTLNGTFSIVVGVRATPTQSRTRTGSPTQSMTASVSRTPTQSGTRSQTGTQSQTRSSTPSQSASRTYTPSQTQSQTPSRSQTQTQTITRSQTQTQTLSRSQAASQTSTLTVTPSQSATRTSTASQTGSQAATPSQTASQTVTRSLTSSQTVTQSRSPSVTPSASGTMSNSGSQSMSPSHTSTQTPSVSLSSSQSRSSSITPTVTYSLPPTVSQSASFSVAASSTVPGPYTSPSPVAASPVAPSASPSSTASVSFSASLSAIPLPSLAAGSSRDQWRMLSARVAVNFSVAMRSVVLRRVAAGVRSLVALTDVDGAAAAVGAAVAAPCAAALNLTEAAVVAREVAFAGVLPGSAVISVSWTFYAVIPIQTDAASLITRARLGESAVPAVVVALLPFLSSDTPSAGSNLTSGPIMLSFLSEDISGVSVSALPQAVGSGPGPAVPVTEGSSGSGGASLSVVVIAAGAAGALVALILLIIAAVLLKRRRKRQELLSAQPKVAPGDARLPQLSDNPLHHRPRTAGCRESPAASQASVRNMLARSSGSGGSARKLPSRRIVVGDGDAILTVDSPMERRGQSSIKSLITTGSSRHLGSSPRSARQQQLKRSMSLGVESSAPPGDCNPLHVDHAAAHEAAATALPSPSSGAQSPSSDSHKVAVSNSQGVLSATLAPASSQLPDDRGVSLLSPVRAATRRQPRIAGSGGNVGGPERDAGTSSSR
jgi:hypothetical protein